MRRATWIAALLLGGCASELHGSLTATLPDQAEPVKLTPDYCRSGQREGFFGVDLTREGTEGKIRGLVDPIDGPVVKLEIPALGPPITLTPKSTCTVFEFQVENNGSSTNNVRHVDGQLLLDCVEAGIKLMADITFAECA